MSKSLSKLVPESVPNSLPKSVRLNVRFSEHFFHKLERRAHLKGVTVAEHIRGLIDGDMTTEGRALIPDLAPEILGASVCAHRLLVARGDGGDLPELARETRRLASLMGAGDV